MGSHWTVLLLLTSHIMAPTFVEQDEEPMSKTFQYRKVMKPLLERKRRARINACLDELKDLMVYALQSEGENISKLEKADVLELTVKHLRKLKRQQMLTVNPGLEMDRYRAGYVAAATEVSRCLASTGVDVATGSSLMSHLGSALHNIESSRQTPLSVSVPRKSSSPVISSPSSSVSDQGYISGRDNSPSPTSPDADSVWRPF